MNRRRSLEETEPTSNSNEANSTEGSPRRRSRTEQNDGDVIMLDHSEADRPNEEDSHESDSELSDDGSDSELSDVGSDGEDSHEDDYDSEGGDSYNSEDYEEDDDEELPFGGDGIAFLNQIQQALLSGTPANQADIDRIRQVMQAQLAQGFFGMARAQMNVAGELQTLLRQVNAETPLETLFAVFSQAWELIVLTGEQLGQQEFDSAVDLRPLIPHLLRVLTWSGDCQLLGLEFLMTAIKCTRGVLQYSPASMRRLVDSGMIPLLTQQLQHVEYIDLAEDLIFILQLLSRPGAYPKACLHANGLTAVLGFVDFHALPVQVSAFTAAAQMCTALAPESYQNYLLPELLAQLKQTVSFRSDEPKLVHWALRALLNGKSSGVPCTQLFPSEFLQESVYPLARKLPADVVSVLLAVAPASPIPLPVPLKELLSCCFKDGHIDDALLESCLSLIICLLGSKASSGQPLSIFLLEYFCVRIGIPEGSVARIEAAQAAGIILDFCTQPGSSFSRLQWRSCASVLLFALESCTSFQMSLEAFGLLSRFISSSDDVFLRLVALRWCSLFLKDGSSEQNRRIAKRQGIQDELRQLPLAECNRLVEEAPEDIKALITESELNGLIAALQDDKKTESAQPDLLSALLQGEFTEFELLGDPSTCVAHQLLTNENLLKELQGNQEARLACIKALNRALLRYAHPFFPTKFPEAARRSGNAASLADALSPLLHRIKLKVSINGSEEQMIITASLVTLAMIGSKLNGNTSGIVKLKDPKISFKLGSQVIKQSSSLIEAIRQVKAPQEMDWNALTSLWSSGLTLHVDSVSSGSAADVEIIENELQIPERIMMAMNLLEKLQSGHSMELSALLQTALDSPLVVALNALPRSFLWAAQRFSFLFPFSLRVQMMRACFFDRFRALAALKTRSFGASSANAANDQLDSPLDDDDGMDDWMNPRFSAAHFTRLPKLKFTVDRADLPATLKQLFAPKAPHLSDARVFEFAYAGGEIGTGHGPTLEFYALTSDFYASKLISTPHGLCPDYTQPLPAIKDAFFQIGAFCGRALLDDRVIDLSLDELILTLQAPEKDLDYLARVDEQLHRSLNQPWTPELAASAMEFPSWSSQAGQELRSEADWIQNRQMINEQLATAFNTAREAFCTGFNASNPADFSSDLCALFTPADLSSLFSSTCTQPWSSTQIISSLLPDHGYTPESPQLHWLAEIIAEASTPAERKAILRFLTGAPGLPVGGWSAIKFTIVSKSDDSGSGTSASMSNSTLTSHGNSALSSQGDSPSNSPLTSPTNQNQNLHDSYLPSVMTCANYLKLPRYSSKAIMRERLWYAINEGNNSFYLS